MMFLDGEFTPETLIDDRARGILIASVQRSARPVRCADVLAAAIRSGNAPISEILADALAGETTLPAVADALAPDWSSVPSAATARLPRSDFTPGLLRALDEFGAVLRGSEGVLSQFAPELLVHLVLLNLNEAEKRLSPALDVARAAALFRARLMQAMNAGARLADEPRGEPAAGHPSEPAGEPL